MPALWRGPSEKNPPPSFPPGLADRAGAVCAGPAGVVDRPHGGHRQLDATGVRMGPGWPDRCHCAAGAAAGRTAALAPPPCQPAAHRRAGETRAHLGSPAGRERGAAGAGHPLHRSRGRPAQDALAGHRQKARRARLAGRVRWQLFVRVALVCVHRRARGGQNHGAGEFRPVLPAGRPVWPRRHPGCGRHPQLRLVVHRRSRADRHRRPLHHPGQPPGRGQGRLEWLSGAAEEVAPTPPAQRGFPGHQRG